MWFHFCTFNHDPIGRSTLADMAAWFEAGLLDLGHKVTFSDLQMEPQAINLLWECFRPGMGRQISETGVKYGIIATEIPDGVSFNWREEPHWRERFNAFAEVAAGSSFIWTMVESTIPYYSQFCPTAFIELGFSGRLIPDYINSKPEFDFSFFGLRTPYRLEAVERIRRHAKVEWPERFLSAGEVGTLIGKTRVGLNFKQSDRWPVPSPTRLGRLLMAKRSIAAERTETETRQGMIAGQAPDGQDFVEFALQTLNSDWKQRGERAFETYRSQMLMRSIVESVLERTVSGVSIATGHQSSIGMSAPVPSPSLIESRGDWNIVFWHGQYFALLQSCGPIDVREGIQSLQTRFGKKNIQRARTLAELNVRIAVCEGLRRHSLGRIARFLFRKLRPS